MFNRTLRNDQLTFVVDIVGHTAFHANLRCHNELNYSGDGIYNLHIPVIIIINGMSILPSVPTVWQCLKVRLQTWICLQPSSERLVITPQRIEMMVVMSTKECLTRSNMIITRSTWASTSHRVTVSSVVTRAPMTARGSPTTNRAGWKYNLYMRECCKQ